MREQHRRAEHEKETQNKTKQNTTNKKAEQESSFLTMFRMVDLSMFFGYVCLVASGSFALTDRHHDMKPYREVSGGRNQDGRLLEHTSCQRY